MLARQLADPVRREGQLGSRLRVRRHPLAVDHPARRHDDQPPAAAGARPLQEVQQREDVLLGVEHRVRDGDPHVHLCGVVTDDVEPARRHHLPGLRRAQVEAEELRVPRHVLEPAPREVVEDGDLRTGAEERVGDVRADETGASGDEDASYHACDSLKCEPAVAAGSWVVTAGGAPAAPSRRDGCPAG